MQGKSPTVHVKEPYDNLDMVQSTVNVLKLRTLKNNYVFRCS